MLDRSSLLRSGKYAWAVLGVLGVAIAAYIALQAVAVVAVPLVLALFPAAALAPVMRWLVDHRVPNWLAGLLVVLGLLIVIAGLGAVMVPQFVQQAPQLLTSFQQGSGQLQQLLQRLPGVEQGAGLAEIARRVFDQFTGTNPNAGGVGLATVVEATRLVTAILGGLALVVVVLFFYFYEGRWMVRGALTLVPGQQRARADEMLARMWHTLGGYFRSLFIIAVADAVLIGIGLWIVGVPLVLPLAILVFFGGFFPYIGATASGLVAVLVAFASGGLYTALAALGVVLGVQALEGNLLQPLIAGRLTRLPAFVVIVAITAGFALLGVFGAFIAVPATAVFARGAGYLRELQEEQEHDSAATAQPEE